MIINLSAITYIRRATVLEFSAPAYYVIEKTLTANQSLTLRYDCMNFFANCLCQSNAVN